MVEKLKYGISINNQRQSEQDITTNHGILRVQEEPTICKSGALTLDGSKYSNLKVNTLLIQPITKFLMLQDQRMKKDKLLV